MNEVLVLGASGQVGTELMRHAWPHGWTAVAPDRATYDLRDPTSLARIVANGRWAAVINAAAYTAVDRAESDAVAAWQVNAVAPAALAAACHRAGVPIVHVSTDYVFDGDRVGAWQVGDPVSPLSVYGASKLGGEFAVRTACPRHAIVRTAWVVSAHGSNFVKTMLRLAAERPVLRVVADQRGSPTIAADLADALATIAMRLASDPEAPAGTWHFSNAGATSWHGLAAAIVAGAAARGGPRPTVQPIATADYPTAARRPANSLLETSAITRDFGIVPRPWQDGLDDILDSLLGAPS